MFTLNSSLCNTESLRTLYLLVIILNFEFQKD